MKIFPRFQNILFIMSYNDNKKELRDLFILSQIAKFYFQPENLQKQIESWKLKCVFKKPTKMKIKIKKTTIQYYWLNKK